MNPQLTKDDTRALWYAVDAYTSMVKAMRDLPTPIPDDVAAKEREVLATAKRALRKVNAIRKAQQPAFNATSARMLHVVQQFGTVRSDGTTSNAWKREYNVPWPQAGAADAEAQAPEAIPSIPTPIASAVALIDREIEDARAYGLRFARDTCFRESAEKKLAVLEELRPKVQALQAQQQTAGAI